MVPKHIAVAIDGPVGAGKSSIARAAAARLGYIYCDTGALYRSVGLYCRRNGVDLKNADEIAAQLGKIKLEPAAFFLIGRQISGGQN